MMNFNKPFYNDNGGCWEQPEDEEMSIYGEEPGDFELNNTVVIDVPEARFGKEAGALQSFINVQSVPGEDYLVKIDATPVDGDVFGITVLAENLVSAINAATGRQYRDDSSGY